MSRQRINNTIFLLALVGSSAIAGCGSPRRGEPLAGPLVSPPAAVIAGGAIFDRKCGPCHPGGEGGVGPALNNKPLPRFLMKFQVRHGLGAMPSFPENEVGTEDLERLLDYLVSLRAHRPVR